MANTCSRHVFGCSLRVARLEADGTPDIGANNLYVSDALLTLTVTPNVEEGDEFVVKSACGELCVNVKDCDKLKRLDMTMGLCYPDPELLELLVGDSVVLTSGAAVGYAYPRLGGVGGCPNGVSVEVWAKRYDASGNPESVFPYEHYAYPRVYLQHSGRTIENGPVTTELTGFAIENENWGNGPENDWPVASDRAAQNLPTATLPTPVCGYQSITS